MCVPVEEADIRHAAALSLLQPHSVPYVFGVFQVGTIQVKGSIKQENALLEYLICES